MKNTLLLFLFLALTLISYSQQIGGIINSYTPVIAYDACENKLTVEDASAFNIGDTVLLIQMKGAVIDSSNTANFGTITDYKNAGNYEFNYVKQKAGNIIFLKNNLTRSYNLPAGKVQLIRVPYYNSVTVTSTLTCLPWDGSKGGVLALNVRDTLYLNNNIDISGRGFWGGKSVNPKSNTAVCNQTLYYSGDPVYAAPKGEGIAVISSLKSLGRGAFANGGGGGIGHNSGGAGGSNGTSGGEGGKEWISCSPASNNGGINGKVLSYSNAQNRIFMGGGGGAGHCDNIPGFNAEGGNGGGILIVQTNFLKANNNSIIAGGTSAAECTPDGAQPYKCHEGMGGGGAGGTVLLKANFFLDNLLTSIKGGKGADMNDDGNVGRLGPGGGGSGGILWLAGNTLPANVSVINTGGSNGVNINYGNDSYGAAPGQNGLNLFNLVIPTDTVLFKKNIDSVRIKDSSTACNSFDFKGFAYTNTNPVSSWQWSFGDGSAAGTQNSSHTYTNPGTYSVKFIVTDVNGCKDSLASSVNATCGPVPVTLTKFETHITNKQIKLSWYVETYSGIRSFTIERSLTGYVDFVPLGIIKAGNIHSYSFVDSTAEVNKSYYYRLTILENNSEVSYSDIKTAKINLGNKLSIIYPNPSNGMITVRLNGYIGKIRFTLINSLGQVALQKSESINNLLQINLGKSPKGVYWLKIEADNKEVIEKLTIF